MRAFGSWDKVRRHRGQIDRPLASSVSLSAESLAFSADSPHARSILPSMTSGAGRTVLMGLFNILEERRADPRLSIRFDIGVLILFSANPATYNRSGKVIPAQGPRLIDSTHILAIGSWGSRSWS